MQIVQRWFGSAVVFALLVLVGAPAWAQYDPCAQYGSCVPCAAQAACGWCGATNRCLTGGQGGSAYCPGAWAWTDNQCSSGYPAPPPPVVQGPYDQCSRFTNCNACAAQGACGWCGAAGRCMAGGSGGSPYCQGGWSWTTNTCPQAYPAQPVYPQPGYPQPVPGAPYDQCSRFTNCNACAAQGACGWCAAAGRCMAGGSGGSPYCQGGWSWTTNTCPQAYPAQPVYPQPGYPQPGYPQPAPGPYDACGRYNACGPCAADAACGWCGATNRCLTGQQGGSAYCPGGWAWTDNQCTAAYQGPAQPVYPSYPQRGYPAPAPVGDPCMRYNNCGPCAADANCGWCGYTNRCLTGGANGTPACPGAWAWTDNQCR